MNFFTKGSRIARLSLGWSLVDGRNGLFGWNLRSCQFCKEYIQTDQRTQKYILTPWHTVQRLKLKKGKNLFSLETLQKKKGKSTKEANVHTNPQQEWTRNKCRRKRRERKKTNKQKTNGHGKHGEKKGKTGGTTTELPTNTPALSKKQNKSKAKNQWKQPREK